ncbi:MAG: hypothetical protein IJH58_01215, partial [Clostridia bacterium]|nr:hypothetical protein [Clostridia bacterium]
MKNETITRAGTRLSERREKREAEAWDNLIKDLNPEEGETPMPASVEEALNGQFKLKDLIKQAFSLKGDTADYDVIT